MFLPSANGGVVEVVEDDQTQITLVRSHLLHEATKFSRGDYSDRRVGHTVAGRRPVESASVYEIVTLPATLAAHARFATLPATLPTLLKDANMPGTSGRAELTGTLKGIFWARAEPRRRRDTSETDGKASENAELSGT